VFHLGPLLFVVNHISNDVPHVNIELLLMTQICLLPGLR